MRLRRRQAARPGYVLIAVLLVIVILSLAAYQYTELMGSEYRSAVRTHDATQARLCAVAGLHYAAGVLADRDTFTQQLNSNPFDNPGMFSDIRINPNPTNPRREGRFSVMSTVYTGGGTAGYETKFGVIDEAGKLNINALIQLDPSGQLLRDALMKLPNMTEDVADAIVDWVDADDDPRPSGVESSYYTSLTNPYKAKNGPLNTLDELLLVKGVTPQLLYGSDRNRNGLADDDPTGGAEFSRGWTDFLTVYGRELNVDSTGGLRVYLNQDDMQALYTQLQQAVGADLAAYIVAYKIFNSVTTVSNLAASVTSGTTGSGTTGSGTTGSGTAGSGTAGSGTTGSGGTSSGKSGGSTGGMGTGGGTGTGTGATQPQLATIDQLTEAVQTMLQNGATSRRQVKNSVLSLIGSSVTLPAQPAVMGQPPPPTLMFSCPLNDPNRIAELLPSLMDKVTAKADIEMVPRININTAPREVLMALTGITTAAGTMLLSEADVENIMAQRDAQLQNPTDPATQTGAWLVTVAKIDPLSYVNLEKYITGRTMVYRVQSIGYFGQGGPVARVEGVIDLNQGAPRLLYFRDLTELDTPRGFEPPRQ